MNIKHLIALLLVIAMAAALIACQTGAPAQESVPATEATEAPVPTEAPGETKPTFVPERYKAELPPEPTVPETVPAEETEPAETEPAPEVGGTDEEDPAPEATEPAATEDPEDTDTPEEDPAETEPAETEPSAPAETEPEETDPPVTVSFDYNAAGRYGNNYAVETYGWIVDSSVEGFYPACSISVDHAINNGGQTYINSYMAGTVDSTYTNLGTGGPVGVWCDCFESDGWIYFVVYYG